MSDRVGHYVMYGAEYSLYSGKLRSYLRKKGIPFVEKSPSILTYKRCQLVILVLSGHSTLTCIATRTPASSCAIRHQQWPGG